MLLVLAVSSSALAGPVVPAGLSPGDTYQLVFVTDGTIDATSSIIGNYNTFVQTQATQNAALTGTDMGVTWTAIASTPDDDARDNAVVGMNTPVYLLDGTTKIADGFTDMWDMSIDAPINVDQFGQAATPLFVWTGSQFNGTGNFTFELGTNGNTVVQGLNLHSSDLRWITNSSSDKNNQAPLYALSQVITVPIPEPTTATTFAIGFGLFAVGCFRRQRRGGVSRP